MQTFIRTLKDEHRLIERAAAYLDRISDEAIDGEGFDAVAALDLLEFLEHFGNAAHQAKEERVLFPALARQGLGGARIAELSAEHGHERAALELLHAELADAAWGDLLARDRFAANAHEYALAQIEHAAKEDATLLRIAEERLDPAGDAERVRACAAIDAEYGLAPFVHFEELLERVAWRIGALGPEPAPASSCAVLVDVLPGTERSFEKEPRPCFSPRVEGPALGHEERFLIADCCELDRDGHEEALVTIQAGQVLRERAEDLALEPEGALLQTS